MFFQNRKITISTFLLVGLASCAYTTLKAQEPKEAAKAADADITELIERGDAVSTKRLNARYDQLEREVVNALRDVEQDKVHYQGRLHQLAIVSGKWRLTATVGQLAERISFRIDPRELPSGADYARWYSYPFAFALSQIGDANVMRHMIKLISNDKSSQAERDIAVWVLQQSFRAQIARSILLSAANNAEDPEVSDRLKRAVRLSEKGDQLLKGSGKGRPQNEDGP